MAQLDPHAPATGHNLLLDARANDNEVVIFVRFDWAWPNLKSK